MEFFFGVLVECLLIAMFVLAMPMRGTSSLHFVRYSKKKKIWFLIRAAFSECIKLINSIIPDSKRLAYWPSISSMIINIFFLFLFHVDQFRSPLEWILYLCFRFFFRFVCRSRVFFFHIPSTKQQQNQAFIAKPNEYTYIEI